MKRNEEIENNIILPKEIIMNEIFDYLLKDNNIEYSLKLLSLSKKITKKLFNEINFFDLFLKKSKSFKQEIDKCIIYNDCYNYIFTFYKLNEYNNSKINFNIINNIMIDLLNFIKYTSKQEKFNIKYVDRKDTDNYYFPSHGLSEVLDVINQNERKKILSKDEFFIITFDKGEWENIIDLKKIDNNYINISKSPPYLSFDSKLLISTYSIIVYSFSLSVLYYTERIDKLKDRVKRFFLLNDLKWRYNHNIKNKTIIFESILDSISTNEKIKYFNELIDK